ncbi:C-type lectin (CTL) or carbohydrate-recognition domain (CRD) [Homalodisca vitripennis]|nr:C-type lectin (CTL) or carbohydrate-recognition domain (CRD) [Homalodisca vitripennis]
MPGLYSDWFCRTILLVTDPGHATGLFEEKIRWMVPWRGLTESLFRGLPKLSTLMGVGCVGSSGRDSKHKLPPARAMPSRWYTLLALPFPDQQVGRREFSRAYRSRAGYFSNPI